MGPLQFRMLGQLEVIRNGERVDVGARQQRAVLALLLLGANRVVSVDRLIDDLWGDEPTPGATATIQSHISRLRRVLDPHRPRGAEGSVLVTRPPGYQLQVDPDDIDARRFERLAAAGRSALASGRAEEAAEQLAEGLALWRGPALAEFADEAFALTEAARLEELRLATTEEHLDATLALGRHRAVIADLEQLVAAYPLRERLRAQLMLALYRSGRQAEALRAYQAARLALGEELGIEPSRALKDLEGAVLLQDPAIDWVPPEPATGRPETRSASTVLPPRPADAEATTGRERPSETVTFLLTDIEGSTRLWVEHPDVAAAVLARHEELLVQTVHAHGGILPSDQGEGDSALAVFTSAIDALAAALTIQRSLAAEGWPAGVDLRVRIGVHTGEAIVRDGNYYGLAVNRTGRLRGLGHGGQALCSQVTADIVGDRLPDGAELQDLGLHRLRDFERPERIFQLCHPDLPAGPPPLTSPDASPHNLPAPLTSFVGRDREVSEVRKLLETARLVTLVGSGGVGKTRLALEVSGEAVGGFPDGAWFVDLGSLVDPTLLSKTISATLGLPEDPRRSVTDTLISHLRSWTALLVLDCCERVVDACAELTGRLLSACPGVRVVATSRESLRVPGEIVWRVPSLSLPDPGSSASMEGLLDFESVRLFMERARTVQAGLSLTDDDAPALAAICSRLDGIPLALELAAARCSLLSVSEIAARLDDRFRLLTTGSRSALARHQTLRAALDWSHDLLSAPEQVLLRRLSVFAGVFALEAVEDITSGGGVESPDILDVMHQLVAKSLVEMEAKPAGTRYRLLDSVREYARQKLAETGEEHELASRHRDWYLALAEQAEERVFGGSDAGPTLDRLEMEHDNFRVALAWTVESGVDEPGLRLAHALYALWEVRNHRREGRRWIHALLAETPEESALRSALLRREANLAWELGDNDEASRLYEEALATARHAGDRRHLARALIGLGNFAGQRGDATARALLEEGLAVAREVDEAVFVPEGYLFLSWVARNRGCYREAREWAEQSRRLGGWWHQVRSLVVLGLVEREQGDYRAARRLLTEGRALATSEGARIAEATMIKELAAVAAAEGDLAEARAGFEEALVLYNQPQPGFMVGPLGGLGQVAVLEGDPASAQPLLEKEVEMARHAADASALAWTVNRLGEARAAGADPAGARAAFAEALSIAHRTAMPLPLAAALEGLATLDANDAHAERAARLLGAADVLREAIGGPRPPVARPAYERTLSVIRTALGEDTLAATLVAGGSASLEQVVAEALGKAAPVA